MLDAGDVAHQSPPMVEEIVFVGTVNVNSEPDRCPVTAANTDCLSLPQDIINSCASSSSTHGLFCVTCMCAAIFITVLKLTR